MSQLLIIEASAGSGKTHRLVFEYLRLLMVNPNNFQHILAVTFTNKATEEMKSRIILELSRLQHICNDTCAKPCKHISVHLPTLVECLALPPDVIAQKARMALYNILHNYSRFAVMTIDSFFQQVLRAFMREAGIGTSTRIELDTDWVIQQAVDRLLLELDTNDELFRWLVHYMLEQISQGKSWSIGQKLYDMAEELLNEKFFSLPTDYQQMLFSENFRQYLQLDQLYSFKNKYETDLKEKARQAFEIIERYRLTQEDFFKKSRGVFNFFKKLREVNYTNLHIDPEYADTRNWAHKESLNKKQVEKALTDGGLYECYMSIVRYLNDNQQLYNDVVAILKNIYTYGVLADIGHSIDRILRENDIQLLSKTTRFINELIEQNDTPFLYEKTGRYLRHFIIDEFQDTSYVQWQNFRPLIRESLANDNFAMVVGDVKQSIYRWRNTDWSILAYRAEEDMHSHGSQRITLDTNWRSLPEIVDFNNAFFGDFLISQNSRLQSIYRSAKQTCAYSGTLRGMVQVDVHLEEGSNSNEDEEDTPNSAADWTLQQIHRLLSAGYRQKDIAVIVRERKEGIEITEAINSYNQNQTSPQKIIHVLSAETALLDKCVAINLITEVFQYILNPDDTVNLAALVTHLWQIRQLIPSTSNSGDLATNLDSQLEQLAGLLLSNPLDLFEEVIQIFHLNQYAPFLPYLQAFHNLMHDFCLNHTPQLQAFMDYWEHKKSKVALEISEEQDAVRILTIHKSKGLQFPNVIIPYCNWDIDYRGTQAPLLWCKASNSLVESLQYIPIRYSRELMETSFAEDYKREQAQYFIDNINLLYVAFTRPMHHLFIYVPSVKSLQDECKTVGDWLYRYVLKFAQPSGSQLHFQQGQLQYVEESGQMPEHEVYHFKNYPVYSPVGKIKQRSAFGGILAQTMQYGNVMHRLFQHIRYFDDIDRAVDILIAEGLLSSRNRQASVDWLRELLTRPQITSWFSPEWKIYTEATVVAPSQHPYRPDRVMIKDNQAIVVDYKFGKIELTSYKSQLKNYMNFLTGMGYQTVEGYLWYVQLDKIEKVG